MDAAGAYHTRLLQVLNSCVQDLLRIKNAPLQLCYVFLNVRPLKGIHRLHRTDARLTFQRG